MSLVYGAGHGEFLSLCQEVPVQAPLSQRLTLQLPITLLLMRSYFLACVRLWALPWAHGGKPQRKSMPCDDPGTEPKRNLATPKG